MRSAGLALAAGLLAIPVPAPACRLALLLALDVSASVDAHEDRLQRDGLAAALTAPEVQAAFLADPSNPVAIAAYEWSGKYNQTIIFDWTVVRSSDDLSGIAATVQRSVRSTSEFPTALGFALGYAASVLRKAPGCDSQTIDVSGDGVNNSGFPPPLAYKNFPLADVTVNGLAVGQGSHLGEVIDYYRREVLKGPGAFIEQAKGYADFERAMRRKLEREIGAGIVGLAEVPK